MKKFLSIILSILMVVTMLPFTPLTASAADETAIVAWNDVNNNAVIDNGETSYQSLQAAFKDSARAYIRLCTDIQLSEQTSIYEYSNANNDFTLDLNGYQVTSTAYIYLGPNVSMTVKDTSTLQTGSMTATESALFYFYGTLTVQNGTFTSKGNIFDNKGTLIINGGEFYATGETANLIGQNGTLTINGGEFNTSGYSVIYVNADSKSITINGGYFGKEGKWGHIYMRYTTPIDLSNHNDPNGITIKNGTGDSVAISQIMLPDGYFLVDPNSETATELSNKTTYSITSNTTPYTVTFDANGGSGEMENRTTLGIFVLPYNGFTAPSGKIFKCWQIGDNEYEAGDRVTLTDNVTVKALWLTPTVYCYDGDELLYTIEVSSDYYSFYLPAAPEAPSDEVFFAGWAIDSPDSDHIYSAGTLHQNVYATRNYYAVWIKPQAIWGADSSSLTGAGTLAEAIEAANADSSIHYIELCEDVTNAEFVINGSDITIDLNGYNISAGEYSVVFSVSSGNLTINNSQSTGGVISGDQVIADVSSGAALTVNGGTFMPLQNAYTIKNQGTLTITGGTFYAKPFQAAVHTTNQNASVTLSGGDFVQESGTKGCIWYIDGILDLSDYADPAGITIYRYVNWESGEFSMPADYALYLLSSGKTAQYENQTTLTICKATGHPGFDEAGSTDNGDGTHSFTCGDCGATVSDNHSGGTATCKEQAKCEHCGASYGELGSHTGGMATCTTLAVCDTCGESYGELDPNNHEYENNNGFCCETYQPAELNENGYYEIGNAGQLFWYANYINTVDRTANAVLTADIDLENRPWTPIGSTGENSNNFRGIFDGQNYIIRGLYVEGDRAGLGFFGEVRTGTVKNFTIYGEVVVNTEVDYVGGVIGSICGVNGENDLERNGAIIQNIKSFVNLTVKAHGVGKIGGFVGYANHQSLIEKCSWYGTFDAGEYRVDSGAGGFIGKIQENSSEVTIRNCGAYGTIKTNYAGDYNNTATIYMGGFLSFSNTNAKTTLENCLFAGRFKRGENLTDEAFLGAFGTLRSVNAIKNCYYLGDDGLEAVHSDSNLKPGSDNVEITKATGEELKKGTVAKKLGEYWEQGVHYPTLKDHAAHWGSETYGYTDNGDGTHDMVCTGCGHVEVYNEAHTPADNATYTENNDGTHSFTCGDCGATVSDNHDFGSGNTCICGAEIAFTGIVVDDENSDEYRYDETRKTYTIIIPADEVGGNGYLSYDIIGTNLTLIEDTNTLLKVQHENEDGLTPAPDDLLVDVLQDNGYFGWSVLGYGDGEWEKLLYSNDGGMTWTTYTFEVKQAYSITVNASQNGTVTANEYAIEGDNIALNVSPAEGYMLDTLSVTDASGNSVDVENNAFTMPASAVTVTATFAVCDHKDGRHETATDNGDGTHSYTCDCGATVSDNHSGGTATCKEQAKCEHCGASYGEVNAHDWSNKDGICTNCGEVCPHEKYTNGVCDKCGYACPHDSYTNGFCTECDAYEPAELNENGYYEIGNAGQLYWFADKVKNDRTNYGSANAILTQNIVVNENVLTADGKLNGFGSDFRAWIPPYAYKGTFDGAGKTVSGLYFEDTEERNVGFIGYLNGGTVKNLTVKDSYFNAYSAVGGIVGSVIEGTVTDCFSSATVIAGSLGYAGGIAGENGAGLVERCANSGFVTSGYEAGGIVGYNHNYYDDPDPAIIRHCYNIGSVSGYTVGGIVGNATQQMGSSVEIDSCWAACELNGTNNAGGLIGIASGSTIRCCSYDKTVFTGNPVGKKTSCNTLDSGFKSTEEFASGAAAYLLNGESSGGFWRQTIGTDAYPGFSGDKVYYGYISCADNAKKVYTNDATATEVKPAHNWSNNDGICANGCGEVCPHEKYTDGVCDKCGYECAHEWNDGVLTRPVHDAVLGSKDGYYTYTCAVCGEEKTETVKSADYSAYEAVSVEINTLLQSDDLTSEAKQAIYSAAIGHGLLSNDLTESEQNIVDDLVAELEKIIADAEEKIASGEYVKAEYTEIDEAIDDIEEKLASENVTDEGKAELEEIKKQLEEMKADENTSAADVAELEKALEDYEEELDKGIEDGTLVKVDGIAILIEYNNECAESLIEKYGEENYNNLMNSTTDEVVAESTAIEKEAMALTGTVAENAEKIAELKERLKALFDAAELCLAGTHSFMNYTETSSAKCEVNAKETGTCWFCGETDEREVEGTALSHSFTKYEVTEEAKCGVAGKEVAYCDNGCQTTDERETPALEHIFLDYVSNGDATCTADGTKTAFCIHGCGTTDTVADEGSMINHSDEDGDKICDDCGEEVYDRCDICGGKAHGDDKIKLVFCMIITIIRVVTAILKSIN